jgi:DNA-binding transcriptional ArsR family regulator
MCQKFLSHVSSESEIFVPLAGDELLAALVALASPHRLRIVAALRSKGRNYVSRLARDVGISRPLLHLHLRKLEAAGLVVSRLELSPDGKALNFFEVADFRIELTPSSIAEAASSLSPSNPSEKEDPNG